MEGYRNRGIRMLNLADNGVRHFTNSRRPIVTPADVKGLKIRNTPSPVFKSLVAELFQTIETNRKAK
jgi:TRAP-type transport system periplasmic protein